MVQRKHPLGHGMAAALCVVATFGIEPAAAAAASGSPAQLEEVVVTAQKREQSLQDVGISGTAFTAEQIASMSLKNIGDALSFAPNIQRGYGPSGSQDGFFFFRGVGQQDVLVVVDPGVAVYIDDVYLGRLQGASFDVLDIQRIELLRGPQGTLFGRNTIGGAVSVHTTDPGEEFAVKGRVTAGSRNRFDANFATDIPLTDTLRANASVYTKQQDGWVTNVDGTTFGDIHNQGGRLKLLWEARDDLTLRLTGDYTDSNGTPTPQILTAVNSNLLDGPLGVPLPTDLAADIIADPFAGRANISARPTLTGQRGGVSLIADWDTGPVNLKSISAWRSMKQDSWTDLDGGPYSVYDTQFTYDQDQFSQEFQLSGNAFDDRLTALLGAYYFGEDVTGFTNICIGTTGVPTFLPLPPASDPGIYLPGPPAVRNDGRCFSLASQIFLDVDAFAGFGNFEFRFTDRLTGLFGLRYTSETKNQDYNTATNNLDAVYSRLYSLSSVVKQSPFALPGQFQYDVSPNNPNLAIPYQYKKTWTDWSPKIGVNYAVTDSTLLYASWSTGFKSGGFGGRNTPGAPFMPYDPEEIQTWEAGIKTEVLDHRLRVNGAAFFSRYDNVQLLVLADVQGTANLFITANGGDSQIYGIELEAQARPIDNLDLSLGVGYLQNKWTKLSGDAIDIPEGGVLAQTPDWTVNATARYTFMLAELGELTVGGGYNYRSDFYFDAENRAKQDAYGVLDLRATYQPAFSGKSGDFTFSVYGLNVLQKEYFYTKANNLAALGTETGVPAPGSEWGVEVTYDFR